MSVSSQLILHPVVSQTVRLWATTLGRDKTYRAAQYFSRFLAWALLKQGNKDEAARWNALKAHLALGRKLLRLFKPAEHLQLALRASQGPAFYKHAMEQYAAICRQLSYAAYLSLDSIVWAQSVRLLNLTSDKANKYLRLSLRFWLSGIVFSIGQGLLKAGRLANEAKALKAPEKPLGEKEIEQEIERGVKLQTIARERAATRYQLAIDILDVWLPATGLGLVNVNEGVAGILGFTTSVMALRTAWAQVSRP